MHKHSSYLPWLSSTLRPTFQKVYMYGQRSLAGYNLWGRKELDMTDITAQIPGVCTEILALGLVINYTLYLFLISDNSII